LVTTAVFENICPRSIIRNTGNSNDGSGKIILNSYKKTANLERIEYIIKESIFLHLLLCKENNKTSAPDVCLFPYKNNNAGIIICESAKKFAHIYFGYEEPEKVRAGTRNCMVVFSKNNLDIDELAQRLENTVKQFGVKNEKYYFYVIQFNYGNCSLVKLNRNKVKTKIFNLYAGSRVRIKTSFKINEKDQVLILKIEHKPENIDFDITSILEKKKTT